MTPPDTPALRTLFGAAEIAARIEALAAEIAAAMPRDMQIVVVLKGGFVFAADLIRALHQAGVRPRIDFMTLSSYGTGTESSGEVAITRDITDDIAGRDVLLVDDILESGHTMARAREILLGRGAASVNLCVLLDKASKRKVATSAEFVGFTVPDHFVVGYGLDYAHYYRDLPYIAALEGL